MSVWLDEAIKEENWKAIADDDTGDVDPGLQIAARKILELKDELQDAAWDAAGVNI